MAKTGVSMNWGGMDKKFGKAVKELSQTNLILETVGEALVSSTKKRFEDEESPDGKAWEKSKRAERESGQTLLDKGNLRKSISYQADNNSVQVGTNNKYARIHQFGGKAGRGRKVTIPARPYIGISKEDKKEIGSTIADFVAGAFR